MQRGHRVRLRTRAAVFGDVDRISLVAVRDPVQQLAESPRHDVPLHIRLFPVGRDRQTDLLVVAHAAVAVGADVVAVFGRRFGGVQRRIVVQPEKIGAPFDQRPLFGGELRQPRADPLAHHGGIVAEDHRIGEPAVEEFDGPLRGRPVLGRIGQRFAPVAVVGNADRAAVAALAEPPDRLAVRKQQMMGDDIRLSVAGASGREAAGTVAEHGDAPRFIQRDPVLYPVAERLETEFGVGGEVIGDLWIEPAVVGHFKVERQVPVVQGDEWGDAVFQQQVDQAVVVGDPFGIRFAAPGGLDAGPRDGKAVGVHAELLHHRDVFRETVVAVAGDVAVAHVADAARNPAEGVPDRPAAPSFRHSAFDLIGRRCGSPEKIFHRKASCRLGCYSGIYSPVLLFQAGGGEIPGAERPELRCFAEISPRNPERAGNPPFPGYVD